MSYSQKHIGSIGVADEASWPELTRLQVTTDTLNKVTICFSNSFMIRINKEDTDALRGLLRAASDDLERRTELDQHDRIESVKEDNNVES